MLHAPMDYLDCACFTGRTSIPIRCIVERVSCSVNLTSPSSSPISSSSSSFSSPPSSTTITTNVSPNRITLSTVTTPVTTTTTTILPLSSSSLLSSTVNTITTVVTTTKPATPTALSLTQSQSQQHSVTLTSSSSTIPSTLLACLPTFSSPLINDQSNSLSTGSSLTCLSSSNTNNSGKNSTLVEGNTISKIEPLPQAISSSVTQTSSSSSPIKTPSSSLSSTLQLSKENLILSTTSSITSSAGDNKNSGEGGCSVGSESVAALSKAVNSNTYTTTSTTTTTSNNNCINRVDQNIDVNPANSTNSNCNIDKNNINTSVNVTGNITSDGDDCVNLTVGEKSINNNNNNTRSPDNNNTGNKNNNNNPNNQRQLNISPLHDLNNIKTSDSIPGGQLSPTSTFRSLFGLHTNPFQLNHHLNLNQSPLNYLNNHNNHHHNHSHSHHNHLHHHLLASIPNFDHSTSTSNQQQSANGDQLTGDLSGSARTFPASISPSGVVEQDSFAIITSGILFSNLVKTALLHLGYSTSEITGAKGFIQLMNWKPLTLDQITDSVDATVGEIMGDISSIASLRIILSRPRTNGPNEIEDKLLQLVLAQSYSLLANSGNPVDQSLLAALIGRNRTGLEAELNEETRGKFDQWYMQQVFNQYRQMATLAAAQAHHQQAAAAAAAVMAATSQQQKHQAAAAALAAAVNAAAAGLSPGSGVPVDGSDRSRGTAAAANCQSLLNLDLDASSLASGHSNHLKDNHHHHPPKHHQQQHDHHHTRGPSLASTSHLPLITTGRSSLDSSPGERNGTIGGDRVKTEGVNLSSSNNNNNNNNNSSSGSTNSYNNVNNSSKDNSNNNGNSNRTSPNAPGQYVRTRIRTSFDPEMELPKLHKWFSENQHPTRPQIQQFVKELNSLESRRGRKPLDVNNVVYWFKNARAAHKRHELKLVNGSQSPTLSNNNNINNSSNLLNSGLPSHLRDPFEGKLGLGSRSRMNAGLIPGLIGDRLGGMVGLGSGRGGNGTETESYPDSNGNEDLLNQMYDDEGSDGGDYEGDDMIMDDDCSSQISQTLDLSVRPVKRQRADSSPPGSPTSGPSSLSDLIRGTPPHTLASASSCHSNFNVKDEPASDEDEDDYDDDIDERDFYPVQAGRHGLNLHGNNSISGRSSGDPHNLTSSYLGVSDGINGNIGDLPSGGRHHSSSSSSHERHQPSSNLNNGGSHGQPDSPEEGRRARRSRTFIDPTTEVPKLEQWFHLCTHPTHPQFVQYTDELNSSPYRLKYPKLEPKNIQFWFKNRRAKSKRQNIPMSSSNSSPLTTAATTLASGGGSATNPLSSSSSSSSTTNLSGTLAPVTTTTTSSSSSSSLSPSLTSNCSVSSLSLAPTTGAVSTSSSALTIDRLIGH